MPSLRNDPYGTPLGAVRAQAFDQLATIAEAREDYAAQAGLLQSGWESLYQHPQEPRDRFVEARLLERLAPLVLELGIDTVTPQLHAASARPWPQHLSGALWTIQRTLAWQAALAGDVRPAFARLLECVSSAPSATLRLVAIADRAELAHEIRNGVVRYEELRRMSALARDVDWLAVRGDGLRVLLAIASAFASEDAHVARGWLSLYQRLAEPASAGTARRRAALEADAQAAVLEAEGRGGAALRLRRRNLEIWDDLGFGWRAAREALAIAQRSKIPEDVRTARARCAAFPRSWLKRRAARLPSDRGSAERPS